MNINTNLVPTSLKSLKQWVLWRTEPRGKPTKIPYQCGGIPAKSNDLQTWSDFEAVCRRFEIGGFTGIGFMFAADDPFCGIDLDGCRDPKTGKVADWAREIILKFASYAELSPSETGVKIFCRGKSPFGSGKKVSIEEPTVCDKTPAIEIYDSLRYFTVTGWRLQGLSSEPAEANEAITWLKAKYWPETPHQPAIEYRSHDAVVDRARKYVAKMPPAVSGQSGHNATFHVACVLVLGFELGEQDALGLLREFNDRCQPPWNERELLHKVQQAAKQSGERGYLRNVPLDRHASVQVPRYQEPSRRPEIRKTTLVDATRSYVDSLRNGQTSLIELGIPELDYAIGGGVEKGEMVIFAARPSHGKSAVALQCLHFWTSLKMPCAIVSEEMSALALGKRTLQFVSKVPQEHWSDLAPALDMEIDAYAATHERCIVLEGCGTADAAAAAIENAVKESAIECAVVDYAQLLRSAGKSRYEQITNTSIMLRQLASSQKIVLLVLCQLSRSIESRSEFSPVMSDLKDTGQLEQDADVIVFLCWPHRIDPKQHPIGRYQFFVAKNRNRPINQAGVECEFIPSRQMVRESLPEFNNAERTVGK